MALNVVGDLVSPPESFLLQLSQSPIRFEPVTKITNVFYDEVTRQVFTVRSGGATGVNVKGPGLRSALNFRVEDKGALLSIKFSPDQRILAIQRSSRSVEFQNFLNQEQPDGPEYSQSCRGSSSQILGFVWASEVDFIVITNQGVEHYQLVPEKRSVRSVKNHSVAHCNWFVYCPVSDLLLVSSGPSGSSLQPYLFKNHQLLKLTKFEVELPNPPVQPASRACLAERDVMATSIYGQTMVLILRHAAGKAEIVTYAINRDSPARKTHLLRLDAGGKLAVSVVDNLIVVHHQASKTSSVFDINLHGSLIDGRIASVEPFLSSVSIRPYHFDIPATAVALGGGHQVSCEMYSPNWVFFQPNIIIDAILGCLWTLELVLLPIIDQRVDRRPCELFEFLLQRTESKPAVLTALARLVSPSRCDVSVLGQVFDKLNESYRNQLDIDVQGQIASPASGSSLPYQSSVVCQRPKVVVDQSDVYGRILQPMGERSSASSPENRDQFDRFTVAVVNEYIRSLVQYHIPVQHFVYEVLIEAMARLGQFYQLHQLFQYHAVADSKPLACLLLSLESVYPAAYQLALDMLKRIANANEEIVEILLSKNKILSALRFARETMPVESISARKFLEAAQNSQDSSVFYGVFKYFQQRNQRARGSTSFLKGEHCEVYARHFRALYGDELATSLSDSLS